MWMVFVGISAASIFTREKEEVWALVSLRYKGALMYTLGVCMIG